MPRLRAVAPSGSVPAPRAPWWDDLTPEVSRSLALEECIELSDGVADVAVVGAGVAGLSMAVAAAEGGASVLVLEGCSRIGEGATGRNAGILSAGINMSLADLPPDGAEAAMWPATTAMLLELTRAAEQPGALVAASLTGALSLARSASAGRHLEREARARQRLGLRAEVWEPSSARAVTEGRLDMSGVVAALWLPDEGRIQPLTLLAQLAERARTCGVRLIGGARAASWAAERGARPGRWRIRLGDGRDAWAQALGVAVGPTTAANARIYALAFAADLPDAFPLFWDAAPYIYSDFRPGNGRLMVSGGRYGRAGATRRDAHYHDALMSAARRWLPELAQTMPSHAWAVDLAVAAQLVPAVRQLEGAAPGIAIEGLGALGVLPGIVLGRRAGAELARSLA